MTPEAAQRLLAREPPRRLAVVQTAFLGDVVFTSPLIRALKHRFPDARLTLVVAPRGEAIARHIPGVDEVTVFDKRGADRSLTGLRRIALSLACDLLLVPHPSLRSAALAALAPARLTVGPGTFPHRFAYDLAVDLGEGPFPQRMLALAAALGIAESAELQLAVTDVERARAKATLGEGRFAAAIVGSEWATKRLPPALWAQVLDDLVAHGVTPALLGAAKERPISDAICAAAREGARYRDLMGNAIDDALGILACCEVALGGDTGLLHAARALGVPAVAIFGPTDPAAHVWEPSTKVLQRGLPCQPCHAHGPKVCPLGHHDCLRTLDPAAIAAAVVGEGGPC